MGHCPKGGQVKGVDVAALARVNTLEGKSLVPISRPNEDAVQGTPIGPRLNFFSDALLK